MVGRSVGRLQDYEILANSRQKNACKNKQAVKRLLKETAYLQALGNLNFFDIKRLGAGE